MATIQFDFNSIKERIKTNLRSKSEWASFLDYGVADNLIDPICQELDYINNYKEYLTYENYWALARNFSSLLVQAPVHGYVIPRKQGATGTLRISTSKTFDTTYTLGANIPIPKFFQFSGNNIYVASYYTYTLTPSDVFIDITCKQGESKTVSFSAQGNIYEEKIILDSSVDNDFYELYVNGILWTRVDTLFESNEADLVYEIETKADLSGITLKFGNNMFGKKLELNDQVIFKYVSTLGADGNIFSPNIITTIESQAFDINGKPVTLYVTNTSAIIGGRDYPTVEEIRTLSPRVYQTGDRASSLDDYLTKIAQFPYIAKSTIWGAFETLKDNNLDPWTFIPSEENVIHVALLDNLYENLSDLEKNRIVEDLHKKNDPTDLIKFETVEKIPLIFNIDGVVQNSSYTLIQVKADIESALKENYAIENIDFNENIYNSDFVKIIDNVKGLRNHNSSIWIKKDGYFLTEAYVGSFNLPIFPIEYSTIEFYIQDTSVVDPQLKLFAKCDVNGNIIGETGYNTNGSNLNITTGVGALVINSGVTGNYNTQFIKILYKSANPDLMLNNRYSIFYYDSSNITLNYPTI